MDFHKTYVSTGTFLKILEWSIIWEEEESVINICFPLSFKKPIACMNHKIMIIFITVPLGDIDDVETQLYQFYLF